jgi:flagellar protein FlaC
MGKEQDTSGENNSDEETNSDKEPSKEIEEKKDDSNEPKKNTDELRKVIKVNPEEQSEKEETKNDEQEDFDSETNTKESLEQKRAILQSIKDFDFQIKKNTEEITLIYKKLESVSKDLDDLVSLYEIVSEQMNPFVGLSKVTKKRIDALENFTKEIDDLKNRMGEIESFVERSGEDFAEIKAIKNSAQKDKLETDVKVNKTTELPSNLPSNIPEKLSTNDLDFIIEKSFNEINIDMKIDNLINDYIENLMD